MRSNVTFLWSAAALLAAALGIVRADVQFRCGRIAGYTEDTLRLETRLGEEIDFTLDEESETPTPLVVGAWVQIEFKDLGPGDLLVLHVLPMRTELDDCPLATPPAPSSCAPFISWTAGQALSFPAPYQGPAR